MLCLVYAVRIGGRPQMTDTLQAARDRLRRWRENPVAFVYENFGVEPDAWQRKVLEAFPDPSKPRISMQACVGPGKTAVEAWCGWNFLSCYGDKGEHPKGAAVAITGDNLNDNLWPEFSKWQQRSEFLRTAFTWTKTRIFAKDHPETWFLSARSWAKTADEEEQGRTLSGLHSKFVLCLFDESGDIPLAVAKAGEQALSTCLFGKMLQGGNPTSLEGMLYAAARRFRHLWHVIRITGDPDDPQAWVHSPRVAALHKPDVPTCACPKCWARQQIEAFGRDNPWVMATILGQFPPASINALLGVDDVERASKRHLRPDDYNNTRKRLGIDAARFGDDKWVIFPRQGLAAFRPIEMRNPRTHDVVARIIRAKQTWGNGDPSSVREFLDDTGGYAVGAIDGLIQAGYAPTPVNFSGKPDDARYYNKRAEMYFRAADAIKRGAALPPDDELLQELVAHTYTFKGNKFLIEDKDQIKEKLGRSPNKSDGYVLTYAEADEPLTADDQHRGQVRHEWDPYRTVEPAAPGRVEVEWDPMRI